MLGLTSPGPSPGHLRAPESVFVERREAVHHDGERQREQEHPRQGAQAPGQLARGGLQPAEGQHQEQPPT